MLGGSIGLLARDRALTATNCGLVGAPLGNAQAFAASADQCADLLAMVTHGTDASSFFRAMSRAMAPGASPAERVIAVREQNDSDPHSDQNATGSNR